MGSPGHVCLTEPIDFRSGFNRDRDGARESEQFWLGLSSVGLKVRGDRIEEGAVRRESTPPHE